MTEEDRHQFLQGIELDGETLMPAQLTIFKGRRAGRDIHDYLDFA